jgi:hypothetical protein
MLVLGQNMLQFEHQPFVEGKHREIIEEMKQYVSVAMDHLLFELDYYQLMVEVENPFQLYHKNKDREINIQLNSKYIPTAVELRTAIVLSVL